VHPSHPLKKEYYAQKASELEVVPPQFAIQDTDAPNKQVDSLHLTAILKYSFIEVV
jgi:hypothetical protein